MFLGCLYNSIQLRRWKIVLRIFSLYVDIYRIFCWNPFWTWEWTNIHFFSLGGILSIISWNLCSILVSSWAISFENYCYHFRISSEKIDKFQSFLSWAGKLFSYIFSFHFCFQFFSFQVVPFVLESVFHRFIIIIFGVFCCTYNHHLIIFKHIVCFNVHNYGITKQIITLVHSFKYHFSFIQ